jgi:hypothetical protein
MSQINDLLGALDNDEWRNANPFSPDITTACDVLLNPYSRLDERRRVIRGWLVKHQPCVFGQAAAKTDRLFISIIDDELLSRGDDAVREKLQLDKQTWKQWSLEEKGRHGFLAAFLSPKLLYAAPNQSLRKLCEHLRSLFISTTTHDPAGNDVSTEWLYLKDPKTQEFRKFKVILDFFASAGDRRWWHDHRFPGGVAFTLNSLGHLARTKEFYEALANPVEWSSKLAMMTIGNAWPHPTLGKATRLVDLAAGKPRIPMECPFSQSAKLPPILQGKDWTTYTGFHHTDHSVRKEFFDQRESPDTSQEYLLDFTYIAGADAGENAELMNGIPVTIEEIEKDIGTTTQWRFAKPAGILSFPSRPADAESIILRALAISDEWLESDVSA